MRPRFLSQKIEANEPEKKMPSTAANATRRSPKTDLSSEIQRRAHSAFLAMQGTVRGGRGRWVSSLHNGEEGTSERGRTGLDGLEELVALFRLAHVRVDEERVDLGVDVLPASRRRASQQPSQAQVGSTASGRTS